jgi:ATP-dependent protease ClpP protease subunit
VRPITNLSRIRAAWRFANEIPERSTPAWRLTGADTEKPKMYVYDVIGGWDLDASTFVQAVHSIQAPAMDVHVNSPGGLVFDAVAMFEALRGSGTRVGFSIDGLAASAASFLAMAADPYDPKDDTGGVKIAKGGRIMIHDASGAAWGNPAEMREMADLLDQVSDDISGFYADRAGGSPEMWRGVMTAETWYSASQAVEAKLADKIAGGTVAPATEDDPEPQPDEQDPEESGPEDIRSQMIRARVRVLTGR